MLTHHRPHTGRRGGVCFVAILAAIALGSVPAGGADRIVLCEYFTNPS